MHLFAVLVFASVAAALDIRECNRRLGMEAGAIRDDQITASSSFDQESTGPQHARIRGSTGSGAWCPRSQINATTLEWLQIAFDKDTVVSAVETQGRFDSGQGREYATAYRLEYWRPDIEGWAVYRDESGSEVIPGNTDTRTAELRLLSGAIVVRKIRLIPLSNSTRTVCMRVEVYGCHAKDPLTAYSVEDGSRMDGLDLRDRSYDGEKTDGGELSGGLGRLFDGSTGNEDFERKPAGWVGWRRDKGEDSPITMSLSLPVARNISAILLHTSNRFKLDAQAFTHASLAFSPRGQHFSARSVEFSYPPDHAFDTARWIRIPVPHRIAKEVVVRLTPSPHASWLLLSEIRVESDSLPPEFVHQEEDLVDHAHHLVSDEHQQISYLSVEDMHKREQIWVCLLLLFIFVTVVSILIWKRKEGSLKSASPIMDKGRDIRRIMDAQHMSPSCYRLSCENALNARREMSLIREEEGEYAEPDYRTISTAPLLQSTHYACSQVAPPAGSTIYSPNSQYTKYTTFSESEYGELDGGDVPEGECSNYTVLYTTRQ